MNYTLSDGCGPTRKRKHENSEDNGTILRERCNDNNAAIGGDKNISRLSGKHIELLCIITAVQLYYYFV